MARSAFELIFDLLDVLDGRLTQFGKRLVLPHVLDLFLISPIPKPALLVLIHLLLVVVFLRLDLEYSAFGGLLTLGSLMLKLLSLHLFLHFHEALEL